MQTPEGKIKAKLDKKLKAIAVNTSGDRFWYFCPQSGPFGQAGIPDRIIIAGGRFFGIECKANKNSNMTDLQRRCGVEIAKAGGKFFVVYDDKTISTALRSIARAVYLNWYKNDI